MIKYKESNVVEYATKKCLALFFKRTVVATCGNWERDVNVTAASVIWVSGSRTLMYSEGGDDEI